MSVYLRKPFRWYVDFEDFMFDYHDEFVKRLGDPSAMTDEEKYMVLYEATKSGEFFPNLPLKESGWEVIDWIMANEEGYKCMAVPDGMFYTNCPNPSLAGRQKSKAVNDEMLARGYKKMPYNGFNGKAQLETYGSSHAGVVITGRREIYEDFLAKGYPVVLHNYDSNQTIKEIKKLIANSTDKP
ncbi:hypothetical protein MM5_036 [Morganella phage vB_Mm5]